MELWRLESRSVVSALLSSSATGSPAFTAAPSSAIHLMAVCQEGSGGTDSSSPRAASSSPAEHDLGPEIAAVHAEVLLRDRFRVSENSRQPEAEGARRRRKCE